MEHGPQELLWELFAIFLAAKAVGELVASHVIPRPHEGLIDAMLK